MQARLEIRRGKQADAGENSAVAGELSLSAPILPTMARMRAAAAQLQKPYCCVPT
jgi:hypothetical protein